MAISGLFTQPQEPLTGILKYFLETPPWPRTRHDLV